jgi:glucuronate isomerase
MNIEKPDYLDYLKKLATASEIRIQSFATLINALQKRSGFFSEHGCTVADHGLEYVMYAPATEEKVEEIFAKRASGETLTQEEMHQFKTAFMVEMGRTSANKNWVMQLHYGVQRDLNKKIFHELGPDAGIDAIYNYAPAVEMGQYLNALAITNELPKTILYSLNPIDNAAIGTVMACFQDSQAVGKMQHGAAWWFNDNKSGMIEQMTSLANLGLLGNFVGMLTDSRSFLSYTRHEYFRRIMCNLIGEWVENGEYPQDEKALKKIVEGIAYKNAKYYFEF